MEERETRTENIFKTLNVAWAGFMGFVEMLEEGTDGDVPYLARLACENALYTVDEIRQAVEDNVGEIKIEWISDNHGCFNPGEVGRVFSTPAKFQSRLVEGSTDFGPGDFPNDLETLLCGPKAFVEVLEKTYGDESNIVNIGRLACENVRRTVYAIMDAVRENVGYIGFDWSGNEHVFHNSGVIKRVSFNFVNKNQPKRIIGE